MLFMLLSCQVLTQGEIEGFIFVRTLLICLLVQIHQQECSQVLQKTVQVSNEPVFPLCRLFCRSGAQRQFAQSR